MLLTSTSTTSTSSASGRSRWDPSITTVAAQAIGSSGSDQSRVFYIDKGANYKLARDMAVITADGIVGKIRDVFPNSAQVLAINDQTSGAGVILETTRIRGRSEEHT